MLARLFSIMSARLRVTVDECIHEYRTIGDEVFGHPGVISSGGTFGHELDCKPFEKVIEDVTGNHCEKIRFESLSEIDRLDQDTCQQYVNVSIVLPGTEVLKKQVKNLHARTSPSAITRTYFVRIQHRLPGWT